MNTSNQDVDKCLIRSSNDMLKKLQQIKVDIKSKMGIINSEM